MKPLILLAFFGSLFFGCSESNEVSLTEEILKIETLYNGGAKKNELLDEQQIETIIAENEIESFWARINSKIDKKQTQGGRLSQTQAFLAKPYDVGVIPDNAAGVCPSWSEPVGVFMDCQDGSGSITRWDFSTSTSTTWQGAWQVNNNKNVWLRFCRIRGVASDAFSDEFHHVGSGESMVLKLGTLNVPGTRVLVRGHDNEDRGNTNNRYGTLAPSISNSNTQLHFLYYETGCTAIPCDPNYGFGPPTVYSSSGFGFTYGVIGEHVTTNIPGWFTPKNGTLIIDDENNGNANYARWDSPSGPNVTQSFSFLSLGSNTTYKIRKHSY